MTETPRETRVLGAVVSLVDSLLVDFDVVELLTELAEHCAQLLDVEAAALLLADPLDQLRLLAATSEQARELELFQLQADEGPVRGLLYDRKPGIRRRSGERRAAMAAVRPCRDRSAGFASVHAVPMRAAGVVMGALGLFGSSAGELSDADLLVGQTLAHIASVAILQEHAPTPPDRHSPAAFGVDQPRRRRAGQGLPPRDLGVSVEQAFRLLRTLRA